MGYTISRRPDAGPLTREPSYFLHLTTASQLVYPPPFLCTSKGLRHFVPLSLASRRDRSFGKSGNQRFFIACPVMSAGVNSVSHSGRAIKCRSGISGFTDCGGKGIRTLDTLLRYTHFPGVLLRPLGHSSKNKAHFKETRLSPDKQTVTRFPKSRLPPAASPREPL